MRALNLQKTTDLIDVFNHLKIFSFFLQRPNDFYLLNPLSLIK